MIKDDAHCRLLIPHPYSSVQDFFFFFHLWPGKDHPEIQSHSHPSVASTKTVLAICSLG